nr:RNA-directed DNA polymerase, eukaryota, reverse transcriptase zinc-binding domain protein [Tanacetum cinerariifolium]
MAYPMVENYIKNTWSKYGLVKSMTTTKGMFFFKFSSKDDMDALIENDGYSAIATKLSTPLMLDSYTSAMCTNLWDRSSYARSIVELRADVDLKDTIVFVVPKFIGEGYTTITIHVEYEWKPPSPSVGNSGGILYVWDPNLFIKEHVSSSKYFLAVMDSNNLLRMKKKLQFFKNTIKPWVKNNKKKINEVKRSTQCKLIDKDKTIDQGGRNEEVLNHHISLMKELNDIHSSEVLEFSQKAQVRWSIEGDENSKYIHGILNSLKINLLKSKLTGIGVNKEDTNMDASIVGCSTFFPPFQYLDKSVKKMVWIGWDKIMAIKKNGGLGVSSLYAINRTLLFKWVWHFLTQEPSLWSRLINTIHGIKEAMDFQNHSFKGSIWHDITRASSSLNQKRVDLLSFINRKEGIKSEQYSALSEAISDLILPQMQDRWAWSINASGEFLVSSVCNVIDDVYLPKLDVPTRWIKEIPIKVNILAWKISLDGLLTRSNLSSRSLDIPSILCLSCNEVMESTSHIFFSCSLARQVMSKVCRWWELDNIFFNSYAEWLVWLSNILIPKQRQMLDGKLVLVDNDEKPLNKVDGPVNVDSHSEVHEVFNETLGFMASTSFKVNKISKSGSVVGNKNLYEQLKETYNEDSYDDDDFGDCCLTDAQMKFANFFDTSLRGQHR